MTICYLYYLKLKTSFTLIYIFYLHVWHRLKTKTKKAIIISVARSIFVEKKGFPKYPHSAEHFGQTAILLVG